jgi:TRAP-type mannitol/chloroaromatic compound transport system permease large subunit
MNIALWVTFLVGMAIGMPLAFAMGGSGLVALMVEGKLSLMSVPQRFFNGINSFPLMAAPFFIEKELGKELVAEFFQTIAAQRK